MIKLFLTLLAGILLFITVFTLLFFILFVRTKSYVDHEEIQKAINKAVERGGGTVHIPDGHYFILGEKQYIVDAEEVSKISLWLYFFMGIISLLMGILAISIWFIGIYKQ